MAITFTLVGNANSSGTPATTSSGTTTTGSNFAICISWDNGVNVSASNPTDNKGNTYTAVGTEQLDGLGGRLRWYVCLNGSGGAGHTASCAFSGSPFASIALVEIKGADTSALFDAKNAQGSGGNPCVLTSNAMPSGNWGLLYAASLNSGSTAGNYTVNASTPTATLLSDLGDQANFWTQGISYMLSSGTGTVTPSLNKSNSAGGLYATSMIVFTEATGGGADTLMGQACL